MLWKILTATITTAAVALSLMWGMIQVHAATGVHEAAVSQREWAVWRDAVGREHMALLHELQELRAAVDRIETRERDR